MVRIDMSEYQERHTVSRLVGAPPGYIGYEEGGQLTEAVRRKPYSVVLFDEIEKAHVDVFNTLLQVLDDGRLTDSHGRTVDFRNTVVIMTSNIGSEYLMQGVTRTGEIKEDARRLVLAALRSHFRPEFFNRVDEIVLFKPLTLGEIELIVDLLLNDLRARLAERRIALVVTEPALRFIAEQGFDPSYGARPLRRFIAREVETRVGRALLRGDLLEGGEVFVDLVDGELTVISRSGPPEERERHERGRRKLDEGRRLFELSDQEPRSRCRSWRAPLRKMPDTAALGGECRPTPTSATLWRPRPSQCSSTCGRPGVVLAGW